MDPMSARTALAVERHTHEMLVHDHSHVHITHYLVYGTTLEHLMSHHQHSHNHAAVAHEHTEQQRLAEHEREAHIHDHAHPVQ